MAAMVDRTLLVILTFVLLFATMYMSIDNFFEASYQSKNSSNRQEARQRRWFMWLASLSLTISILTNHWLDPLYPDANTIPFGMVDILSIIAGIVLTHLTVRLSVQWNHRPSLFLASLSLTAAIFVVHFGTDSSLHKPALAPSHAVELVIDTLFLYGFCTLGLWLLRNRRFSANTRSLLSTIVLTLTVLGYHDATSLYTRSTNNRWFATGSSLFSGTDIHLSAMSQVMFTIAILLILTNGFLNRYLHRRQRVLAENISEAMTGQQGLVFMLVPNHNTYVFRVCDGDLLYKMGWSPLDILGRSIEDIASGSGESPTHWLHYCESAMSGEDIVFDMEVRGIRLLISMRAVERDGANIAIVGSGIETTSLQRAQRALSDIEQKYRLIVENTSDLIFILSSTGQIMFVSSSSESLIGFSYRELRGGSVVPMLTGIGRRTALKQFAAMRRTGEPIMIEHGLLHKDGTIRSFESRCVPICAADGKLENVVVVGRDITERKQNEEMLRRSENLSVLGQLAAGMAHEIRNPLTSIRGFVQLLKDEQSSNPYWPIILNETKQIEDIVAEFLSLAKPQVEERTLLDLGQLLQEVQILMSSQAILKNAKIELVVSEPVVIQGVLHQLKQVFTNVVKNAIEAIDDGGRIHIVVRQRGIHAIVVISDDGPGIEPSILAKLGEPFYSTKSKGTGLGLLISNKIVQEHSGVLNISSRLGIGTAVELQFPAAVLHEVATQ